MSLFQSNLRKQIRKLPKILKFVRIIHYFSKLFTGVLTCRPSASARGLRRRRRLRRRLPPRGLPRRGLRRGAHGDIRRIFSVSPLLLSSPESLSPDCRRRRPVALRPLPEDCAVIGDGAAVCLLEGFLEAGFEGRGTSM